MALLLPVNRITESGATETFYIVRVLEAVQFTVELCELFEYSEMS